MENFILRIGCITLNELLMICNELSSGSYSDYNEMDENLYKDFLFCVLEELDNPQIKVKNEALLKLFRVFLLKPNSNFLFETRIDSSFNTQIIEYCLEMNVLQELSKNLSFLYSKLIDFDK